MAASQPARDSTNDATGDFSLPASEDRPSGEDICNAAELPIFAADGTSRPFKSLYVNSDATQRVLIVFIRHFFCGSCQEYIRALSRSIPPSTLAPSSSIVIIGCGEASLIPMYIKTTNCIFPIYAEPTRKLYDIFSMTSNMALGPKRPDYIQKSPLVTTLQSIVKAISSGRDALKGGDFKQVGGEFLFQGGEVKWCHRMQNTRDHAEVDVLKEVLGMNKEKK